MNDIKVTDAAAVPGSAALLVQNGDKAFMYDTGFGFCAEEMADTVEKILGGKKPDAIILTHSHYDHVMGCAVLADRWGDIPVIAGEYTAYVFTRPTALKTIYEMDVNAAHELDKKPYLTDCTDRLHVDKVVKDGEVIDLSDFTAVKARHSFRPKLWEFTTALRRLPYCSQALSRVNSH